MHILKFAKRYEVRKHSDDCTIQTLATALSISYDFSVEILERINVIDFEYPEVLEKRRPKNEYSMAGNFVRLVGLFGELGVPEEGMADPKVFLESIEEGVRYIIITTGHTKVAYNGKFIDIATHKDNDEVVAYVKLDMSMIDIYVQLLAKKLQIDDKHIFPLSELDDYIRDYNVDKMLESMYNSYMHKDEFAREAKKVGIPASLYQRELPFKGHTWVLFSINPKASVYKYEAHVKGGADTMALSDEVLRFIFKEEFDE